MKAKIVILCGPTAVGKTALAEKIAEKMNAEIISADSGQVWRGLDIGTDKPSLERRGKIPYHLMDVAGPGDHFDVSLYQTLADQAIADIVRRGKGPLVVGGAGLYMDILLRGLCPAPPQDKKLREALMQEAKKNLVPLYVRLKTVDPILAGRLHPQDTTRIVRGLEVFQLSGQPLSQFQKEHQRQEPRYKALKIGLKVEKPLLMDRINQRVDQMIKAGWLEETKTLLTLYEEDSQALQTIGYRQWIQHLKGELTLEKTVEEIKRLTKAFAKRQGTWFKRQFVPEWFSPLDEDQVAKRIKTFYEEHP